MLMLVEQRWATELLDEALAAGGFPMAFGCLEPETMLVIGPQVASAACAAEEADVAAAARGAAAVDSMASGQAPSSMMAAGIIRALLVAGVIREANIDQVVTAPLAAVCIHFGRS